jgi:hypothetical protein
MADAWLSAQDFLTDWLILKIDCLGIFWLVG